MINSFFIRFAVHNNNISCVPWNARFILTVVLRKWEFMEMKNTYLMPFYPNDDVRYNISYYYIGLKNKIKYTSKPTERFYNKYNRYRCTFTGFTLQTYTECSVRETVITARTIPYDGFPFSWKDLSSWYQGGWRATDCPWRTANDFLYLIITTHNDTRVIIRIPIITRSTRNIIHSVSTVFL